MTIADNLAAIDFLNRRSDYVDAPRPDLIWLELNLGDNNGRDLLAQIEIDPQLRRIPIVVLTTAANEADIFSTYLMQGNCHVVQSTDLTSLKQPSINILTKIQSHGVLLVLQEPDLTVIQVSNNPSMAFGLSPGNSIAMPKSLKGF